MAEESLLMQISIHSEILDRYGLIVLFVLCFDVYVFFYRFETLLSVYALLHVLQLIREFYFYVHNYLEYVKTL